MTCLKVAYLVNKYPEVSHAFIRREIAAIESMGIQVQRFTIRPSSSELVDEADRQEQRRTQVVLGAGVLRLLAAALHVAFKRPRQLLGALRLAMRIGRGSDRGLILHLIYLVEACVVLRWLESTAAQHLHAHFGTNSAAVAMLCHALGGPPYSFSVHGPTEFDRAPGLALDEKIARASFVIAISHYTRSQLFRWCRYQYWSKIHVAHPGLDEKFLGHGPTPIDGSKRVICVGRLSEQKGHLLLVEAAARLAEEGLDFELVLVGDGEMRGEIESMIVRHGLKDQVRITGWASSDQVRQEIAKSRVMCQPSFAEGLPSVLLEAFVLGRPVISTTIAGIPELVEPQINGWLVPPGSVDALVGAMRDALSRTSEDLERMGARGGDRVRNAYRSQIAAARLASLFRQSIQGETETSPSKEEATMGRATTPDGAIAPPSKHDEIAISAPIMSTPLRANWTNREGEAPAEP